MELGQAGTDRLRFRSKNPEIDAKLFLAGNTTVLRTAPAKAAARRLLKANPVFFQDIPAKALAKYKKGLGDSFVQQLQRAAAAQEPAKGSGMFERFKESIPVIGEDKEETAEEFRRRIGLEPVGVGR